jgi:hypothetical protein
VGWAVAALCLAPTRSAAEDFDPFHVPAEQFHRQVKRVVLRPLAFPIGTHDPARVRTDFEALLSAGLERRGFSVVASTEFEETWRGFASDLGGVFDSVTGEREESTFDAAWEHTTRELERRLDVDAILSPSISFDAVTPWHDVGTFVTDSRWKALDEVLTWQGQPLFVDQPQRVEGPYLSVRILDRGGVALYSVRAPIEWARVFALGGYEERPADALYRDAARNRAVVELLLEDLAQPAVPLDQP